MSIVSAIVLLAVVWFIRLNMSMSCTVMPPQRMTAAITAQIGTANKVVIQALRFIENPDAGELA